jgi:hypothetical protein
MEQGDILDRAPPWVIAHYKPEAVMHSQPSLCQRVGPRYRVFDLEFVAPRDLE